MIKYALNFLNILIAINKKRSRRLFLDGFWASKTILDLLVVPSWFQDAKKHPQDQFGSHFWEDDGKRLQPIEVVSICDSIL